ncbi:MAG: malonate transporter subunit MadL [Gammaproteobacteria bacterium]|nr:malonate transporter subunit MadL [Gammaproteobacteria bacterium]
MIIYGVALLSACMVLGLYIGEILGVVIGVQANVGGVGIAMLLLVLACSHPMFKSLTEGTSGTGIKFWSAMYIPIVVAMAARQNVVAAVDGGMLALLAGALAVIVSFALVPVLSRIGTQSEPLPPIEESDKGEA